jgi:short-subunit dehydrogenase
MQSYFKNKIVWITGASSGIGEALAYELNKNGAFVILSARNTDELQRVKNALPNKNIDSTILPLDMQNTASFETLTASIIDKYQRIDILINNAGISQRALAMDTTLSDDKKILDTNLFGPIALSKSVLPYFIKQGNGHIVNISSVMGKINTKYRTTYAASKHGMIGYFDSLRLELEGKVKITNIMPGFINTNIVKNAVSTEYKEQNLNKAGMSATHFAIKAVRAIAKQKREIYIGGFLEGFALVMKRLSPTLFDLIIKNKKVT